MNKCSFKYTLFTLLLLCCFQIAWAQQTVKGKVLDDSQQPLPGVNVLVKGSTVGTATDVEGNYSLQIPDGNSTLVFSAIGFITEEIAVNNQTTINLTLVSDIKSLNEVVVTALGIERETKTLGYAVTEVKGANFTQARETNLGNALSGRIAGVNASPSATGPGGSSRIVIRGNTSLSGTNQPLYVINGIPIDNSNQGQAGEWGGFDRGDGLNSLNPDDIESISVLKGGTAAALYGSRAASGVILITTKSGKGQQGIGVEFNSTYTMERPINLFDWQYEYGSGTRGAKPISQEEAISYGLLSWGDRLDGSPVTQFDGVARPYSAQKNNLKNFYDNGSSFTNTVAVAGGNEVANFRFSASNLENQSMIPNSSFNRKTFNLSANANLSKKVIFESNVQYNIEKGKNRTFLSDSPKNPNYSAQLLATNIDIRSLNPGYDERGYEELFNSNVYATNPYFAVNKVTNEDDRRRLLGSFSLRYNITDFLYVRGRLGTDYFTLDGTDIEPTGIAYRTVGGMNTFQQKFFENNAEVIVGFTKDVSDFSINVIAGGNMMKRQSQRLNASGNEFSVPFSYFLSNLKNRSFSNEFRENAINSVFASADIGYRGWLYLNLTGRQDWFSTLSLNDNSIFYPSAGVSFVFSEAFGMPAWLNFGKVRASWAQVGGGYPDPYGLTLPYSLTGQGHLGQPLMNIATSTIPNPNLKPLLNTSSEIGVELKTLNNRLGVDLALYKRLTTDDPVLASTSQSSGYNNVLLNVGEVSNKGIELLLTGTPVKTAGFNWDVSYNVSYNKNEVVSIAPGLKTLYLGQARTQNGFVYHDEGQPFGVIKGYEMKRDANGNIVYNEATGVPVQSELKILGQGVHPWAMGITNTFTYKNFNLNFLIDGKFGGDLYSATNAYAYNSGLHKNTLDGREAGIPVSGVDTKGEPYSATVSAQDYYRGIAFRITDEFVYDASFIKLRQVVFGYSVPKSLIANTPFQSASLSFVARNLLILYKNVPNADPESNYNSSNAQGLEMFGVPTARSYGLNLMIKF
ncbi:SusC/RagA family TonB-linked outer membrane protein [Rhodocytophaga aerolata]|uniref:SusC/RagA family TonB-linked outer membrane protein n=1 Tax=Rhodocytophaga aerolata TaxID=455078 RepID=A0ABT8RD09_9BACT|nr:SusC/RagA family TonB-linked outer membrane protein [Rhodocytophaga aerolata]MDO1448570.1 SusC/RagA family TonB-linked outer membrane protein [Rhodocytophaga aerolata]